MNVTCEATAPAGVLRIFDEVPGWVDQMLVRMARIEALLAVASQRDESALVPEPTTWMECEEAAVYLKLTPKSVREGAARGTLPGHKYPKGSIRGRWRFKRDELDEHLRKTPRVYKRKGLRPW